MIEKLLKVALLGSTWVLYLLLALSVVSISAMIERWWFFRKHHDDVDTLRFRLHEAFHEDDLGRADELLASSPSIEARVLRSALRWARSGPDVVGDVLDSELGRARHELERGLTLLGTLGNNAPFVGLLGTVLGVIEAFHHLSDTSNKNAMGNVMGGIAEALIATGVGLFVALPAVVGFNLVQKKIGDIEEATRSIGKLVTAYVRAAERDGHGHAHAPLPLEDHAPVIHAEPTTLESLGLDTSQELSGAE